MAKKNFRVWMLDEGRGDVLNGHDPAAVAAAQVQWEKYLKAEDAKADPLIAYQRQSDRLREVMNAVATLMARSEGRRFPASIPMTWAEVAELRQKVNGLRRVLGLNEEAEALPADTPPAP